MAKLNIPRGLYLQARVRARGDLVFRWGHAPGLRARGIRPLDLFADGRPLTAAALEAHGLPAGIALPQLDGRPMLHDGRTRPLALKDAIEAARQLTAALPASGAAPAPAPAAARGPAPRPVRRPGAVFTVGDLVAAYLHPSNTRLHSRAPDTVRSYQSWRGPLLEVLGEEPCATLGEDLIEEWFGLTRLARGHRMAYGSYQLLRRCWNWGRRTHRLHEIHWTQIETPLPPMKLRVGSADELAALLQAMDNPAALARELGLNDPEQIPPPRPELGDSLVIAIWTAQRARDVLTFTEESVRSGRLRHRTSKKGTKIDMPLIGDVLPARLEQLRWRRAKRKAACTHLVLHPEIDAPYVQKTHGKHFRQARALAARKVPSLIGEGADDWGDTLTSFTFEDCRDTGITRLLRAGCTIEQVASWSNHTDIEGLRKLAGAYMDLGADIADLAGDKLAAYAGQKGFLV